VPALLTAYGGVSLQGTVVFMRPTQLKIALLFCLIGLLIDVLYIPINKELYDGQWLLMFGIKSFVSFLWLITFILIYRGFGGLRFVYAIFFILGLGRIIYLGALPYLDIYILTSLFLSAAAIVLWFLPASNQWFKQLKVVAS